MSGQIRQLCAALVFLSLAACATPTFDKPYAEADDKSYAEADVFGQSAESGVLIYLHGCKGGIYPWIRDWIRYLTANGFVVIAPDSFADPRPPATCSFPYPQKETIYGIRKRQAKFAIARVREEYPGVPIFVWGHSEGGGVVNLLDVQVDGIISSGYQCGYRSTGITYIRRDVPFLALQGTDDFNISESLEYSVYLSLQSLCAAVMRSPQWRRVEVQGMGHTAPRSYPAVLEAVNQFLGIS